MSSARSASSRASAKASETSTRAEHTRGAVGADEKGMVGLMDKRAQIAARVAERVGELVADTDAPGAPEFALRYFAGVDDADLGSRSVEELAAHALAHWRLGATRPPNTARVAVTGRAPGSHTVIDIVNDD